MKTQKQKTPTENTDDERRRDYSSATLRGRLFFEFPFKFPKDFGTTTGLPDVTTPGEMNEIPKFVERNAARLLEIERILSGKRFSERSLCACDVNNRR